MGLPFPRGTLIKIETLGYIHGQEAAAGCRKPESVYWPKGWVLHDLERVIKPEGARFLTGMILDSLDATTLSNFPYGDYLDEQHTIYQVQVGDRPPLWFPWRVVSRLTEEDD